MPPSSPHIGIPPAAALTARRTDAHGFSITSDYGHATASAAVLNQTMRVTTAYVAELPHTHNPHDLVDVGTGLFLAGVTTAIALRGYAESFTFSRSGSP